MTLTWKVMYRLGFTPWEDVGDAGNEQIGRLLAREGFGDPPYGKALDIGCGRGEHTLRLARLGWQVTGLDFVPQAVKTARQRATTEGLDARFVTGDATTMSSVVGDGYRFLVDIGCYHLLDAEQQAAYAREATAVSEPDAIFLLFAFQSGTKRPMPPGIPQERIEETFADWKVTDVEPGIMPPRLEQVSARWYRLQRR